MPFAASGDALASLNSLRETANYEIMTGVNNLQSKLTESLATTEQVKSYKGTIDGMMEFVMKTISNIERKTSTEGYKCVQNYKNIVIRTADNTKRGIDNRANTQSLQLVDKANAIEKSIFSVWDNFLKLQNNYKNCKDDNCYNRVKRDANQLNSDLRNGRVSKLVEGLGNAVDINKSLSDFGVDQGSRLLGTVKAQLNAMETTCFEQKNLLL